MDFFSDCSPARVYAILSISTIIGSLFGGIPLFEIIKSIIGSAVWLLLLNWLCGKGFTWLSWFLVVFPFIILIGVLIGIFFIFGKMQADKKNKTDQKKK